MAEPIKIAVGNGATKSFDSFDEFENWLKGEQTYWNKVFTQSQGKGVPSELLNHIEKCFGPMRTTLAEAKQKPEDAARIGRARESLRNLSERAFAKEKLFLSSSPQGKFVSELLGTEQIP